MNIAVALHRSAAGSLTRGQIAGRLSLFSHSALTVAAERGLTVRVHRGRLWIGQAHDAAHRQLHAGDSYAAEHDGELVLRADTRSELEVAWPATVPQPPSSRF
jgi:hypothetical protein